MKILLVAPLSKDTVLGVIGNYCRKALLKLGQQVDVFDFRSSQYLKNPFGSLFKNAVKKICSFSRKNIPLVCSLEQEKMNKMLLLKVEEVRPDIVLVVMGDSISAKTLQKIKEKEVILANWFLDTVLDPDRKDCIRQISGFYDYFFVYDSEDVLQQISINSGYAAGIPLACDPDVHKSISLTEQEHNKYGSEICFVGSMKYKREELLKSLCEFDLAIWGNWENINPALSKFYRQKNVYDEELAKVYNGCKIALDIHIFYGSNQKAFDINPRVYESTACGAFTITNDNPYLAELFEIDKEIVCYKSELELKDKIKYYLEHPSQRETIAKRGQQRARREHTYENRLEKIISIIKKRGF